MSVSTAIFYYCTDVLEKKSPFVRPVQALYQ